MRLPNGFGRIVELKGKNLRKPFRAMVSVGKDENGKPIGKILKPEGYFETYNEAYEALMRYHASPYDFDNDVTLSEVYIKWFEEYKKKVSPKRAKKIGYTYRYLEIFGDTKIQTIKQKMVKTILESCYKLGDKGEKIYPSENTKVDIKTMLKQIMDYAVENEIIDHNYVTDVNITYDPEVQKPHVALTEEDIQTVKQHLRTSLTARMIYIQCYTGLRPDELCHIELGKVNFKDNFFICGSKTAAGKNRRIPIHRKIKMLLQTEYADAFKSGKKYLFGVSYKVYFSNFVELLPNHRPHDCRKYFITMAKNIGVDEYAIKRIVGHAIDDITENVYTERTIAWLTQEINKIP